MLAIHVKKYWSRKGLVTGVLVLAGLATMSHALGRQVEGQAATRTVAISHDVIVPHRPIWREGAVEVRGVEVEIDIVEQVATVQMAVTLFNPSSSPREAQLVLPVPSDAAIRSFGIDAISEEPNAILLPRDEATRLYRDIVRKMVDPGLLEFVGTGLIQSSVFPVPAGGTQTFRVVYEHALRAESGRVDYVLGRSQSVDPSVTPWQVTMRVRSTRGVGAVYSPTHDVGVDRLGTGDVRLKVRNPGVSGPVRVSFLAGTSVGTSAAVLMYPDERVGPGGGYFLMLVDAPQVERADRMKREVTVVFDRSGSMRGGKIEQAQAAALQIVEALDDGEYFNIIDYSDTISKFSPAAVEKTPESIERVRAYIGAIKAMGGTNIHDALLEAVRSKPREGLLPLVLFMTDGLATVGTTNELAIREGVAKANEYQRRIFSFGVGFDVNAPLLSGLASGSRAVATFVDPQEDVEVKVGQAFAKLAGPVLVNPVLVEERLDLAAGPGVVREVLPGVLPDLFAGEQLIIVGQYTAAERANLAVSGLQGDEKLRIPAQLDPAASSHGNAFIARLWAQRKIGTLIDALRQRSAEPDFNESSPAYKELVDEIVVLSKEFGILTEYTAFIALEEEYRRDLADKGAGRGIHFRSASDERAGREGVMAERSVQSLRYAARPDADAYSVPAARAPGGGEAGDFVARWAGARGPAVQSFAARTVYRRAERWVDASLLETPDMKPDREIAFDSADYDRVLDQLVELGEQGLLALDADVLIRLDGDVVLIRAMR
jgi:Ca-activated chloride channel family protein